MGQRSEADPRYLELLEVNRRLRELTHRKDDAMAVCAHDLRSPLNVVLGHVRLLLRGSRGPLAVSQRQSVEAIERQVLRMVELVEDLLDLRALERGRLSLDRRPGDLGALVEETCGSLVVLAQSRGHELSCEVVGGPIELPMDAGKLREVLENLVGNALRVTPAPGKIGVRLTCDQSEARLEVHDTGPGIDPEVLPKLFDGGPGWRRERRAGGSNGLGLSICKEIVELHDGRIEAYNARDGGATFVVHLPRQPLPAPAQTPVTEAPSKPRVLLAEDDPDARAIVSELLGERYSLVQASDGEEALRLARATAPELILMDLFMPRLDGFAALEDLRRDPRTADVPVILLSAQNDDLTKVRGLDLGAADFLVKPFSGRELMARVAKALQQKRQRE
ncbi:MAG: ATP-binding response regulator, partial [Deltaproteobacteria bacterium]